MKPRVVHVVFSVGFLALLCSAGMIQVIVEVARGERLQALDLFRQPPTVARLRAYEQRIEDASWVAGRLRPWMQYAQFLLLRDAGDKALAGRDGWLFYKPGFQYLVERPPAVRSGTKQQDPLRAILDFRDQLAGRGVRFIVVVAPNKESVYPEQLTRRARGLSGVLSAETRRLLCDLEAAGVEVVDLFQRFTQAKQTSSCALYLTQDSHWSPAGVELAARAVAEHLTRGGWGSLGAAAYESRPTRVRRLGDVLRMLQAPPLERCTVPEEIVCHQVVRLEDGQLYRDDPGSSVLVLGDSFLWIYQQDEPRAAGFIAHLAKEIKQPVTSLVNEGGASTLVRQQLNRRPALLQNKKAVIWEFVERDIRFGAEGWQPVPLPPMPGAETSHSTVQLLDFTRPMRVSPPDCRTNALFVPELATTATVTSQSIRNP